MTTWPASPFPQVPLARGYSEAPFDNVIRFSFDTSPAQARQRHTRELKQVTAIYRLTKAQKIQIWDPFWINTIYHGAEWFDWYDTLSDETRSAQFMEPPSFSVPDASALYVDMSVRLQVWM